MKSHIPFNSNSTSVSASSLASDSFSTFLSNSAIEMLFGGCDAEEGFLLNEQKGFLGAKDSHSTIYIGDAWSSFHHRSTIKASSLI